MKKFHHAFEVQAPLDSVANFHKDSSALILLTPPPVRVEIDEPQSIHEGTSIKFVMWFGSAAVRWTAVHENVDPLTGFDDIQVEGPFGSWKHKHRFAALTNKSTEIRDEIEAEMGSGWRNSLISRILWLSMQILFAYRTYITRKTLESAPKG